MEPYLNLSKQRCGQGKGKRLPVGPEGDSIKGVAVLLASGWLHTGLSPVSLFPLSFCVFLFGYPFESLICSCSKGKIRTGLQFLFCPSPVVTWHSAATADAERQRYTSGQHSSPTHLVFQRVPSSASARGRGSGSLLPDSSAVRCSSAAVVLAHRIDVGRAAASSKPAEEVCRRGR